LLVLFVAMLSANVISRRPIAELSARCHTRVSSKNATRQSTRDAQSGAPESFTRKREMLSQ
jgi:hypothetical protein